MTNKLSLSEFIQSKTDDSNILPPCPGKEELKLIRKGLRKKLTPDFDLLPSEFEYEGVGKFSKNSTESDVSIVWEAANGKTKNHLLSELCLNVEQEQNRLEFGWMIANFAKLDSYSYLSQMRPTSYEDHHQNQFNKQYAKQEKHFLKIENDWRHWAVVPAGHMLFK